MTSNNEPRPEGSTTEVAAGNGSSLLPRTGGAWRQHPVVLAGLLLVLVLAAYAPALRGGFIWDDDIYVTENPMLTATNGLQEIWFSAHTQSQYFPLVYTTLRFEHGLWGFNPVGYHLVNILLHGLNAILVWIVLKRLRVPGAWLAGAIFGLHPVNVESVAWVTELKNVESLFFYLLAVLFWLKFIDTPGSKHRGYYGLALAAGVLAMLAKTTACTLPAALALVLLLRGIRLAWPRAVQILPFLISGVGMGLVSVWWEKHLGNYDESFGLSPGWLQRTLIASRALWFYAGKLIWPANLCFSYPHWEINPAKPAQYLPLLGCLAVAVMLWVWRKKIGCGAMAGVIFFVAALSPLLGFINEYTFHYTYVADHYQYNATIGLIALFAAAGVNWLGTTRILPPVQGVILLALGCLTWQQCHAYRNLETLWRDTLAKNPESYMAEDNFGLELSKRGQLDEALQHFRAAVALYPTGDVEQNDLATALIQKGFYLEAVQHLDAALAVNPRFLPAQLNLGAVYWKTGDYAKAESHLRIALQIEPNDLGTLMSLGDVLKKQGRLDEALDCYRRAADRFPSMVEPWRSLAGALSEMGQPGQAIIAYQTALSLAPDDQDLLVKLGYAYVTQTNYEAAADCYRKALQAQPANPLLHYYLGATFIVQNKLDAARQEMTEALRLKPDFSAAQKQLQILNTRTEN